MVQNPPEGYTAVTPYLLYEDLDESVRWLISTFGLTEDVLMKDEEGRASHAELKIGDGVVMMGRPSSDYKNPKHLGGTTHLVHVYVDDVDRHYEAAKAAGANITQEPADQFYGDRSYRAEDPEGHVWFFAQHVRDVAPEDMHP
jgi:uncharacterized glyoxalase superfamily protein PhnB